MSRKKKPVNVEREVRRMESRVGSVEGITKFTIRVQLEQLTQADQLRKLAIAAINSSSGIDGKWWRVNARKMAALEVFATRLHPFTRISKKLRAKLRAFSK